MSEANQHTTQSLADKLTELQALMQAEGYDLPLPPRTTRPNAFIRACEADGPQRGPGPGPL
jgi:hypothetical protein